MERLHTYIPVMVIFKDPTSWSARDVLSSAFAHLARASLRACFMSSSRCLYSANCCFGLLPMLNKFRTVSPKSDVVFARGRLPLPRMLLIDADVLSGALVDPPSPLKHHTWVRKGREK